MRASLRFVVLGAGALACIAGGARAQDGDHALASAHDFFPEAMAPGPGVGEPSLPTPPQPMTAEPKDGEPAPTKAGAVHLSLGLDLTNAYFYRGLRVEDSGLIAQPWATVGFDLVNTDDWTLQAYAGTWNSWHDNKTDAVTEDETLASWYESDLYFGLTATTGRWELGAQYGWFVSPSDAFTTVEEVELDLSYDDSECMGNFALSPSVMLVAETGEATSDGFGKGVYAQASIEPGLPLNEDESATLSFPVIVGVSANNYYEHDDGSGGAGSDDFFGFASIGAKASYAFSSNPRSGAWTCYVAANLLVLGDLAKEVNDDDGTAFVVTAGLSMEY